MNKIAEDLKSEFNIYIDEKIQNTSKYLPEKNVIIITDDNVNNIYSEKFPSFPVIVIVNGEQSKSMQTVEGIVSQLIELQADRNTFLLGIGGGVVCDITGFVASIFMRAVSFGFVSTSLLSQVDASIGGKNGVNFNQYKNILGTFNQPEFVICDTQMLKTLPQKEIKNGLGEIIKHAIISGEQMFDFIENNINAITNLEDSIISKLISESVSVKAKIVIQDEKEQNERKKLNLGHTLAHAIEKHSGILHGEAVSIGIVFSAYLSVQKNLLSKETYEKIKTLLIKAGLPVYTDISRKKLADAITKDKKKNSDFIDFVYIEKIGNTKVVKTKISEIQDYILNY